MKQTSYTTKILTASEGCYLTENSTDIADVNRTLTRRVYLSEYDSPRNWKEITEEEAKPIKEAIKAAENAEFKIKLANRT